MNTDFAEKIYEVLNQTAPDLPGESRRFFAALQDMAMDFPQERKTVGRFSNGHFIEICMASVKRDPKELPAAAAKASEYLCDEYLMEEDWAKHLSDQFVLGIWAYENDRPIGWIRSRGKELMEGRDAPYGAAAAAYAAAAGGAAAFSADPADPSWSASGRPAYGAVQPGNRKRRLPVILGVGALTVAFALAVIFLFDLFPGSDPDSVESGDQTEATQEKVETGTSAAPDDEEASGIKPTDRVIAHYGTGGSDNPITNFDVAASQGATRIEQDVVLATDGQIYVYKGGVSGARTSSAVMQQVGAPLLGSMFEQHGGGFTYVIELKTTSSEAAAALADLINDHGKEKDVIIQCFESSVLSQIRNSLPDAKTMYLCDNKHGGQGSIDGALDQGYIDIIAVNCQEGYMTLGNLNKVHDADKEFCAWLLDSDEQILEAIDMGMDCYFTTNPGRAIELEKENRHEQ